MIELKELTRLRKALEEESDLEQVARTEFGIRNVGVYERHELIEACVGAEYRTYWE